MNDHQIFGSFYLSDSEFALCVSHVQEVVNAPERYTAMPLAPGYLKGLFNLRGTVIPVLDLFELLRIPAESDHRPQKIAVVELDGACVGLLFDKTGEVFKNNDEEKSDFESSDGVISGVFKKDAGTRIVQILDVTKIFKLEYVPKNTGRSRQGHDARGPRSQCISFVVGPARCALPISAIQEILKVDRVHESALGVGDCIGAIDLRGTTVPVIDFAALLKYREVDRSEEATQGDRRIVVMRLEKELFGLMVDSIDSIISFFQDELLSFARVEQEKAEMFLGCITGHGSMDILLLDHQKILSHSEINQITRGHSKLYNLKESEQESKKQKACNRKTYITFKVDHSYAIEISQVKEVISFPHQLLQPPGLKKHVLGVLNLRGDLVTIVDARSMYSAQAQSKEGQKVLVFKRDEQHFGLVVDSVESIITFAEQDKLKIPKMLYDHGEGSLSSDVCEAVEVTDSQGRKVSMLIVSADTLAEKAAA